MSTPIVKSDDVRDEVQGKFSPSYQSVWMAHWAQTNFKSAQRGDNQSSLYKFSEDNLNSKRRLLGGPEIASGSSKFIAGVHEVKEGKMINFMNDNSEGSQNPEDERFRGLPFPTSKSSQTREATLALENGESSSELEGNIRSEVRSLPVLDLSIGNQMDALIPKSENRLRRSWFLPEHITKSPDQQVNSNKLTNILACPKPFPDELFMSTSKIVSREFMSRLPLWSPFSQQNNNNQPSASVLVHGMKMNGTASLGDPSTSKSLQGDYTGLEFKNVENLSDTQFSPSQVDTSQAGELHKLYHEAYSLPRISSSVHGVETMRIYTTVDTPEVFAIDPPKFSQTTHHYLITEKTDLSLSDGNQILRESTLSKKLKGKATNELLSLAPNSSFHVKQGVTLQPLDSSTASEEKDNIPNVQISSVNLGKESSTETDIMDMDDLKNYHLSGVASSPSNKDVNESQKSASQDASPAGREEISSWLLGAKLPHTNKKYHAVKDVALSADKMETTQTSTSRTQSLDVDRFLSHAEHPTNSRSSACPDDPVGLEPSSRWIKRLKRGASGSVAYGTKSSKMEEASSSEKVGKNFGTMLQRDKTNSQSNMDTSGTKVDGIVGWTEKLLGNVISSSSDSVRKDITLSHAWIQRWCRKSSASQKMKPEALVICEPQSTKGTVDDLQKKQFPSIGAMALMGKAMNGFRPCQFRKKGSFVVWNHDF